MFSACYYVVKYNCEWKKLEKKFNKRITSPFSDIKCKKWNETQHTIIHKNQIDILYFSQWVHPVCILLLYDICEWVVFETKGGIKRSAEMDIYRTLYWTDEENYFFVGKNMFREGLLKGVG